MGEGPDGPRDPLRRVPRVLRRPLPAQARIVRGHRPRRHDHEGLRDLAARRGRADAPLHRRSLQRRVGSQGLSPRPAGDVRGGSARRLSRQRPRADAGAQASSPPRCRHRRREGVHPRSRSRADLHRRPSTSTTTPAHTPPGECPTRLPAIADAEDRAVVDWIEGGAPHSDPPPLSRSAGRGDRLVGGVPERLAAQEPPRGALHLRAPVPREPLLRGRRRPLVLPARSLPDAARRRRRDRHAPALRRPEERSRVLPPRPAAGAAAGQDADAVRPRTRATGPLPEAVHRARHSRRSASGLRARPSPPTRSGPSRPCPSGRATASCSTRPSSR